MKTTQTIWLCLLLGLLTLSSCSTDNSENSNPNPESGVRIKTMTQQEFIGGQWKDAFKTTNTFQGSNLMMSSSLTQKWDAATSNWVNYNQSLYTLYDSSHASQQIIQNWDTATSVWVNANRHTFTDSASGKRLVTETEIWTAGTWEQSQKTNFIYDDNDFLIRTESYLWVTTTSSWGETPANKAVYTNNAQGKPTLVETFIGVDTTPYSKEMLTYDGNGFLLNRTGQFSYLGNWIINYLFEQTNLANGFPDFSIQTNYGLDGNVTQKYRYLYEYY